MSRFSDLASKIVLGVLFAGALALLVFNVLRSRGVVSAEPVGYGTGSGDPVADRPADVGNPAGEDFLRKVAAPPAVPASGLIRIPDESFSAFYDELYDNRSKYYGREIELAGYVTTQDGLGSGAFLVGRDLIWCCEADKYFIGFLAFAPAPAPAPESEILIRGTLEAAEYTNPENGKTFTVPAIRVVRIDPAPGLPRMVVPN